MFDEYARFCDTGEVAPDRGRLNLRYEAIFTANRDIFDGARVLDLACHDGRWSFAALRTGACHVIGIEARREFVERAETTFAYYGQDSSTYRFICDDVLHALKDNKFDVDVVLNLGYIYHTLRHTELLSHLRGLNPSYMIVDSRVLRQQNGTMLELHRERPHLPGTAVTDPYAHNDTTLVGLPSASALMFLLETYDFGIEQIVDWQALTERHPDPTGVADYTKGERVTLRARSGIPTPPAVQESARTWAGEQATPQRPPSTRPQSTSPPRWRHLVNRALARATGYELRRVP